MLASQPEESRTQTKGTGYRATYGVDYRGQGAYSNFNVPVSDVGILQSIIRTYFYLNDVKVTTDPNNPRIDAIVNINIDVFGSIRSRLDTVLYNKESVKVQTVLEVMAINYRDHTLMMIPQTGSYEAKYDEKYAFWIGPLNHKNKRITHNSMADPMLVSFADVAAQKVIRDQQRQSQASAPRQFAPPANAQNTPQGNSQNSPKNSGLNQQTEITNVQKVLMSWLKSWESRDVAGYLSHYSPSFVPPPGKSVTRWKQDRTNRLTANQKISIKLENAQISLTPSQQEARVTFNQIYKSDTVSDKTFKTLTLQKVGGLWKIIREQV